MGAIDIRTERCPVCGSPVTIREYIEYGGHAELDADCDCDILLVGPHNRVERNPLNPGVPVTLVALTPHAVDIHGITPHDGYPYVVTVPPSGQIARVAVDYTPAGEVGQQPDGSHNPQVAVELFRRRTGEVEGLPEPVEGTIYIVSGQLLAALKGSRPDVVAPGELVRDKDGQPIGCRGLTIA